MSFGREQDGALHRGSLGTQELLDEIERVHEHVVITRKGRPSVVMMAQDEYDSLIETLEVLTDPDAMADLAASQDDVDAGDLAVEPDVVGRPLIGRLAWIREARVGNYRVLYTIEGLPTNQRVVVRSIRHRAVAYVPPRRRQ